VSVVKADGKIEKRKITPWYSDWMNSEVMEWLKEWEKVLEIDYDANTFKPEDFDSGMNGF
jgi:hypothetical protein